MGAGSYADSEDGIKRHKPKNEGSYSSKKKKGTQTKYSLSFQVTNEFQRVELALSF